MVDHEPLNRAGTTLQEARASPDADELESKALHALSLLMDALADESTYAAFHCPQCDWFRVGLISGDLDTCRTCGSTLMEKPLMAATVFRNMERVGHEPKQTGATR